jgi:hypothetical protein
MFFKVDREEKDEDAREIWRQDLATHTEEMEQSLEIENPDDFEM